MFVSLLPHPSDFRRRPKHRCLRLESLECRELLTAVPPKVTAVNFSSSQWNSAYVSYLQTQGLGTNGYSIPAGNNQTKTLPWSNLNQIRITFDQDVHVKAGDLSVSGTNTTAYAFSDFSYESSSWTATWTLASNLTKDKILLDLDGDGMTPVHNAEGQLLDGAWIDGTSSFPSGDGNPGTDFQFRVNILPADTDKSNLVTNSDSTAVGLRIGKSIGVTGYLYNYDLDGSGTITYSDYSFAYAHVGNTLPTGSPAGLSNDAPTTISVGNIGLNTNAADTIFGLRDLFLDQEDSINNLTFSITSNTNTSLFTSVTISQGQLVLALTPDTEGNAAITIRATDSGGLFVETTIYLNVADTLIWIPNDNPPEITDFIGVENPDGSWTFSGTVSDIDQEVAGMVVTFGGVLENYGFIAIVHEDGTFSLTENFPGLITGTASARTFDALGMASDETLYFVLV
jgi:hypothetical protein